MLLFGEHVIVPRIVKRVDYVKQDPNEEYDQARAGEIAIYPSYLPK